MLDLHGRVAVVVVATVAKFAVEVVSPSVDEVVSDRQAMGVPGGDGGDTAHHATDRHRRVADVVTAITQLTIVVLAPGKEGAVAGSPDCAQPSQRRR